MENKGLKKLNKPLFILIVILGVLLALGAIFAVFKYQPLINQYISSENREILKAKLDSFGPLAIVVLFLSQVVQVILAFIPSEPIELISGMSYGTIFGALLCMSGIAVGSALVFVAVRRFGQPLVSRIYSQKKLKKMEFLNNHQKLELVIFILYFIPAMPKDVMTYLAALTPISLKRFLGLTLVARIPSVFTSTYAGARLIEGNILSTVIVFSVVTVVALICLLLKEHIFHAFERRDEQK